MTRNAWVALALVVGGLAIVGWWMMSKRDELAEPIVGATTPPLPNEGDINLAIDPEVITSATLGSGVSGDFIAQRNTVVGEAA